MKFLKIFALLIFLFCFLFIDAYGNSEKKELEVKREKDKTVYSIGSETAKEKDQTEEDRKNSWDMLKNMNIRIDKR